MAAASWPPNVTEDGDHVAYQTPAGEMSIPKSIVARIEHDDLTYSSACKRRSEPPVSAPHDRAGSRL